MTVIEPLNIELLTDLYTQPSLPTPMASKLLPLRVFRSVNTVTTSRLMSFSDGGGEPSTQPFQPFRQAMRRFFWGGGLGGGVEEPTLRPRSVTLSPSLGVYGLFEEVAEVAEDIDGSGVVGGDEGMGGGVTETERCMLGMWIAGRACQKGDAVTGRGCAIGFFVWMGGADIAGTLVLVLAIAAGGTLSLRDLADE